MPTSELKIFNTTQLCSEIETMKKQERRELDKSELNARLADQMKQQIELLEGEISTKKEKIVGKIETVSAKQEELQQLLADNEDEDLKNAVNAIGENIELYTQIQEDPEGVVDANTNTLVELGEYQEDAEPDVKVDAIIKKAMETRTLTRKEQEERDAALAAEGKSW